MTMKMWKKGLAVLLSAVCVMTCMTGCGKEDSGKKGGNSTSDIEISYWNAGLDNYWLEAVIEAFEEKYPEYNVSYTASASQNASYAGFGVEGDTVDLYLSTALDQSKLETLDDVLNSTADGDKKPIAEKFSEGYLALAKAADGHYYDLTYGGGVIGFVYNTEHFKDAGITQLPRTTNEISIVCDKLYSKGYTPLCHFSPTGYWHWMSEVFFSQYEGMDYYINNFYSSTDENGTSPSKDVFKKQDGRYQVLKAYEKIITPEYILEGSNSVDHVTAQTQFLNGKASMMVNGSWITTEMASVGGLENYAMLRTPVISSITDKLTTVKTEGNLRKLISAIDAVADGEKQLSDYADGENYKIGDLTVSAADWEYVRAARLTVSANYSGHTAQIPNYSNNIKGAKEFLRFLYSDEGYKVYEDTLKIPLPLEMSDESMLDTSKWNSFELSQLKLLRESDHIATSDIRSKHRIFTDGGANSFASYNYITAFCTNNAKDRKTANQIWEIITDRVDEEYENSWLKNIK